LAPQNNLPTYALVIGVSEYQSDQYDPLPAARSDAKHFALALEQWEIPRRNIILLLDPTREQFESNLNQLREISGHFIFYFCGHGDRSEQQSSLIFSDGAVELETLLFQLYQLKTTSLYLFIDACHLRLNTILNPKLLDSSRSLYCLLSSGILPSFENDQYGYFTATLIKGLSVIRQLDRSPARLLKLIQRELLSQDLPEPEMYNIGTVAIDFFPELLREKEDLKKAISAVYSCGIFIDGELFCQVFNVNLTALEELGLIFYENGSWHPHESLIEIAETEQLKVEEDLAKTYWFEQLKQLPDHFESALHFVMSLQCFGYEPKFEQLLLLAYQKLAQNKAWEVLKKCSNFYTAETESSNYLSEILIQLQEFDLAKTLLSPKSPSYCHLLWRTGDFAACIEAATKQINTSSKILYHFHRGIAHYFLGNWEEAYEDFSFIHRSSKDPQMVGRAKCLLGTINGIRGMDLKGSKAQIESGVAMLKDPLGAWVGWSNLGEIMWKAGELQASEQYLQRALAIAENSSMLLETYRNFLQLELRKSSPSTVKLLDLLKLIEALLEKPPEPFEAIQIYNTLCTAYYYLNDLINAQKYLRCAIPLTTNSKEYHIYTLSNLSLLEQSNTYFEEALALAKKGSNQFAINQIKQDHLRRAFSTSALSSRNSI